MCVQNLDDSRGLAIRITYRISLRSSSLCEPRHPLLKVVMSLGLRVAVRPPLEFRYWFRFSGEVVIKPGVVGSYTVGENNEYLELRRGAPTMGLSKPPRCSQASLLAPGDAGATSKLEPPVHRGEIVDRCGNDPSAGSPTETLLRLHLPLNDKVWTSSHNQLTMK